MRARTLDMYLEMFVFQTLIHLAYVPQVRPVNNNKGTKTIAPHPSDVTSVACPMVNCMSGGGFQPIGIKMVEYHIHTQTICTCQYEY